MGKPAKSSQCTGRTAKGARCKHKTTNPSGLCGRAHAGASAGTGAVTADTHDVDIGDITESADTGGTSDVAAPQRRPASEMEVGELVDEVKARFYRNGLGKPKEYREAAISMNDYARSLGWTPQAKIKNTDAIPFALGELSYPMDRAEFCSDWAYELAAEEAAALADTDPHLAWDIACVINRHYQECVHGDPGSSDRYLVEKRLRRALESLYDRRAEPHPRPQPRPGLGGWKQIEPHEVRFGEDSNSLPKVRADLLKKGDVVMDYMGRKETIRSVHHTKRVALIQYQSGGASRVRLDDEVPTVGYM